MHDAPQMTANDGAARARRERATRHDRGSAMLVVMGAAAVLFVIAASVIGVVVFQQTQQVRAQAVVRASALAQQGMEVYLGALRNDPDYWDTTPTIAGRTQEGTWTVAANAASNTITAVGRESGSGMLHVIKAEARPESYSDYTIVTGGEVTLGRDTGTLALTGSVLSNGAPVDLAQAFNALTVYSPDPETVKHPENAKGGVQTHEGPQLDQIMDDFPNLFTAASQRDPWATGASVPLLAEDLVKPMAFYRDPSYPTRSYWGVPSEPAPSINVTDLVGVGIDFKNLTDSERSIGQFYVRSMWSPYDIYENVSAADKAKIGANEFKDFARQDPTWNARGWRNPELPSRPKSITARALAPSGNNVIYVGGNLDVYITGTVPRSVTIVSERDIYIIGDVKVTGSASVGLVAGGDIYICGAMPRTTKAAKYVPRSGDGTSVLDDLTYTRAVLKGDPESANSMAVGEAMGDTVEIQADLMAVGGSIYMDPAQPDDSAALDSLIEQRTELRITGSMVADGGIHGPGFVGGSSAKGGFARTVIGPDSLRTGVLPPPLFPKTGSGSMKVVRWDEYASTVDPNAGLMFPAPGDYSGGSDANKPLPVKVTVNGIDDIKPITTDNLQGSYNERAVISLSVSDAANVGTGRVWQTWYRIDDGPDQVGRTVIVTQDPDTIGMHTITYWSQDAAGNMADEYTSPPFLMRGKDTKPAKTTVRDSNNPDKVLDDGYPQIGQAPYEVWGEFVPQFTAVDVSPVDGSAGTGVNQIWVSRETRSGADVAASWSNDWTGSQTPLSFAPVAAPSGGSVELRYQYFSYDKAGNREKTRTLSVTQHALDTLAPIVTHDVPQSMAFVGKATIHLKADDYSDGQGVRDVSYRVDGGEMVTIPNPTFSRSMVVTLTIDAPKVGQQPVEHTLQFYATDAATNEYHVLAPNVTNPETLAFYVGPPLGDDITPPVTSSDAQPEYVGPASITLSSYDEGGVDAVYWQLDGGATQTGASIYVDAPWSGTDPHTLAFWAVDTSGNTEATKAVSFTISREREKPFTSSYNEEMYNTDPARFQLTAEDNPGGSGLKATYYTVDGSAPKASEPTTLLGLSWAQVTGEGWHHVGFYSEDNAGNREDTQFTDILIDTIAPATTDNHLATTYTGQAMISLDPFDAGSGVSSTWWVDLANNNVQVTNAGVPILLGPGTHDIQYWSVDKVGNTESRKSFSVTVEPGPDNFAPISFDSVDRANPYFNRAGTNPAQVSLFSWDVQTGIDTMYYVVDGGPTQSFAGVGFPPASYQVLVTGDASHTVDYWAKDKAGNVETKKSVSFKIDRVFPVTTCSALPEGHYWSPKTFVLQGNDSGSGIKNTFFRFDGGSVVKGTKVFVPTPRDGSPRSHVIEYWSVDKAGNEEPHLSVRIWSHPLDQIAPTTYSDAVANYPFTAIIALRAYDNFGGSGVVSTHFILDGNPETTGTVVFSNLSGQHTLEFWSVDAAGNIEEPHKTVTFRVKYFAPETRSDALRWYNKPAVIHLSASDAGDGSDLANMFYRIDGGAIATGTVPTTTITVSGEGDHKLEFWSTDRFGNVEATQSADVGIDLWPPITTSNAVGSYEGTATFALIANDQVGRSGIKDTYWRVDGSADGTQTGAVVTVAGPGGALTKSYTVYFWSEDKAGNVESPSAHHADFTIGPLASMTFFGMFPSEESTIKVRETTVSVSASSTVSEIKSATGMIDGIAMPVTFSATSTASGGLGFTVTGANVTTYTSGSNTVVVFKSAGSITVPGSIANASVLVVGGGGGGGGRHGGGGGAGKYVTGTTTLTGTMDIVVGDGGPGASGGSMAGSPPAYATAQSGGTSRGFGLDAPGGAPGTNGPAGASGQGNAGGNYYFADPIWHGGGGGGSAAVGGAATSVSPGAGGAGTSSGISGSTATYAAGGAGGGYQERTLGSAGAANTGNGGNASGGETNPGGAGGSGIVIVSFPTPNSVFSVTGGVKTTRIVNGQSYDVITFTSPGNLVCSGSMPGATVLVVGGGGGGAGNLSGGGGGGGFVTGSVTLSGTMAVGVGAGGATGTPAKNGQQSSFGGLIGYGGGHGAYRDLRDAAGGGVNVVGSGGGGATYENYVGGVGTPGQGYNGGNGVTGNEEAAGGGGGGAGGNGKIGVAGTPARTSSGTGGDGGAGRASTIPGDSAFYGGGGGGSSYYIGGNGGIGGGGKGAGSTGATAGLANTGGGGGGGANGGSGIVIISYPTPATGPAVTTWVANASFQAKNLLNGWHWASFTFENALGQKSTKTWKFYEGADNDVTPPVTTSDVASGAKYTTGTGSGLVAFYPSDATIRLSAVDEVGGTGVASTSYRIDGGTTQAGTPPTTTVVVTGAGAHTLEYWSTDRGGAVEATKSVKVVIDVTPPTTTSTALTTYKGVATVSLTATDNAGGSGVRKTYYTVDGVGAPTFSVTGGVKTFVGDRTVITFTSSGSLVCSGSLSGADVLVVGGGGGGMTWAGGGGGGGGVVSGTANLSGTISVTVGTGGLAGAWSTSGVKYMPTRGGNSALGASPTAVGGGYGGSRDISPGAATVGGSGGGGGGSYYANNWPGAQGTAGPPCQGYAGGNGTGSGGDLAGNSAGGGGGGAGGAGGAGASLTPGIGGTGVSSSISGSAVMYGGGGGGSCWSIGAAGGLGGGGKGGDPGGSAGAVNTGGGGGASPVGAGGSGIVIISFPTPAGAALEGTSVVVQGPLGGDPVSHTVRFWSVDNVGNVETSSSATFSVSSDDKTPPVTTVAVDVVNKSAKTITLTATDVGTGVAYTKYKVTKDDVPGLVATGTVLSSGDRGSCVTTLSTGTQGKYRLEFWSVDKEGNTESTRTADYVVDTTPPTTSSDAAPTIIVKPVAKAGVTGAVSQTFGCTWADQTFLVPANVTTLSVTLYGGGSDDNIHGSHGGDGVSVPVLNVTPGSQITIRVGSAGSSGDDWPNAGWPDGQDSSSSQASGSGGSTTVLLGTTVLAQAAGANSHRQYSSGLTTNYGGGTDRGGSVSTGVNAGDGSVQISYTPAAGSQTFSATGADQTFTVPAGITQLTLDLYGAQGSSYNYIGASQAGWGGRVQALVPVTPGETLTLKVGTSSITSSRGWPNGGSGGATGFGGGGSTSILRGSTVLVEAGGGGGASGSSPYTNGTAGGALGSGGTGNATGAAGSGNNGGGGGGWTAGAAGTSGIGAKGGTSYVAAGTLIAMTAGSRGVDTNHSLSLNGLATISYVPAAPTTTLEGGWTTINLSASDQHPGTSGVQNTYWTLDSDATMHTGNAITIQGPARDSAVHHIRFWSDDKAGNMESPAKEATFTLKAEAAAMAWSNETPSLLSIVKIRNPEIKVTGTGDKPIVEAGATLDGVAITRPTLTLTSDNAGATQATARFTASSLSDGVHTVTFTFVTSDGLEAIHVPWTFVVAGPDQAPPVTTSNVKPSYVGTATITLSAVDASPGVKATYYKLDGTQSAGTVITVAPPQYGDAVTHNIRYWSVDGFDNVEGQTSATFTVAPSPDTTPPVTTSDAKSVYDGPVTIRLSAQDNPGGWGVDKTYYRLDASRGGQVLVYGSRIDLDPPSSSSTTHTLEFWSTDRKGNKEATNTVDFTVNSLADFTAPTTIATYDKYTKVPSWITLTANDNQYGTGVDYTKYQLTKNGVTGPLTTGTILPFGIGPCVTVLPTGTEGSYSLDYWSIDKAVPGNRERTKTITYWVDSTAPTTTCNATSTYVGPAAITLSADDGAWGSGVYRTEYKVDGAASWTVGSVINVSDPISGSAAHYIDYRSTDYANNTETEKRVTFNVTSAPADVTWTNLTPSENATVGVRGPVVSVRGTAAIAITGTSATLNGVAYTSYATGSTTDKTAQFFPSNLADGAYRASFTYTLANGRSATRSWDFIVDGPDFTAPITTSDNKGSYEGPATIKLTAVDPSGAGVKSTGVNATYYRLNGESADRVSTGGGVTSVSVAPPVFGTTYGRSITYYSIDNQGNREVAHTDYFNITASPDTTAPNTACTYGSTYNGQATGISLTASDNVGGWGLDYTKYSIDSGATQTVYTAVTAIPTIAGPKTGSATHWIYFWSADKKGNKETAKSVSFIIYAATDVTKPVTSISASHRYNAPSTITLTSSDVGQGVNCTVYQLTADGVAGATTTSTANPISIPTGSQGSYTLRYWSVDNAGNKEDAKSWDYVVDQTRPATVSDRVATTYTVTAMVKLTAKDEHPGASGIQYTTYQIDNETPKTSMNFGLADDPLVTTVIVPRKNVSGLPEVRTLTYYSTDWVGWRESPSRVETVTIAAADDHTKPVTTSDRRPFYNGPSTITLTATDAGWGVANTYSILDDGSVMTGRYPSTGGSGPHTLRFWSVDNAGNKEDTQSVSYNVDMTSPVTSAAVSAVYQGAARISLTATDGPIGSGVVSTWYRIDDGTQVQGTVIDVPAPRTKSKDHHIDFWSVDAMGNTESPAVRAAFTVNAVDDTTAPTTTDDAGVLRTYPKPGTIALTATDAGWGVRDIRYQLDSGPVVTAYSTTSDGVASATARLDTGLGGTHTLKYWSSDQKPNYETTHTITYTVTPDTTAPTTVWSGKQPAYTDDVGILLTATDLGWGVQYTHYTLDGGSETSGTYIGVSAPMAGTDDHTLVFWSKDWAGNTETAHTETFTVKAVPATMSFSGISPAEGSSVGTTSIKATITASSNQNIASVTMRLNGVPIPSTIVKRGMSADASADLTGLTKRSYTLEAVFTGADGRQNSKTWVFSCSPRTDYTAPQTISDLRSSYFGTATISLTASDIGGDGVAYTAYKVDNSAWTTRTTNPTVVTVYPPASGSPVVHKISYWSIDTAGNQETTITKDFTVGAEDTTPPVTTSNATAYYKAPGTILLFASDTNGSGVNQTYFRFSNDPTATAGTMIGTGGAGEHTLWFWSVDNVGHVEPTNTVTFIVDELAPTTTSNAARYYEGVAKIDLSAQDLSDGPGVKTSGIRQTFYTVDDGAQNTGTTIEIQPPASGSVIHHIDFWSEDRAGNSEQPTRAEFSVQAPADKTPPVTNCDFKKTYAVPGLIKLSASDAGWGVANTSYKLDSGDWTEGLTVRTGGPLPAGQVHTLLYRSMDKGGNLEEYQTATYTVSAQDGQPPVTSSDATTTAYRGSATLNFTVTDNSGAPCVTYYQVGTDAPVEGTKVTVLGPVAGSQDTTVSFWSIDINGNVEEPHKSVRLTINMMSAAMTFDGFTPADGDIIAIRNPSVSVTAHGDYPIAKGEFELDGVSRPAQIVSNGNAGTLTYGAASLKKGRHDAKATFTDSTGGVKSTTWSFSVDAPADTTMPRTFTDAKPYYRQAADIHVTAADEVGGSGVAGIYCRLDGGSIVAGLPPTLTINVPSPGPHNLEYWSVDTDLNEDLPHKTIGFNVDLTPPHTGSDVRDDLVYLGKAVITLAPDDFADGSGIAGTHYTVDGVETSGTVITVLAPVTVQQDHLVTFWSVDQAGNVESPETRTITVWPEIGGASYSMSSMRSVGGSYRVGGAVAGDAVAPTTTSNALATYSGTGQINLTALDEDGGSGVAHTYYRWDGGPQTESTIIGVSGVGTHQVLFWSVDAAGNAEAPVTVTFQVTEADITAPVTTSDAVTSYAGTATVTLVAADGAGGAGVRGTFYRLDFGPAQQGTAVQIAPPASGQEQHTVTFWSVDNVGNAEAEKAVTFAVLPTPDTVPPTTSSDAVASYAGTATIALSPTDGLGGSGVAHTYFRIDYGPQQAGTSIVVPAPLEGTVAHHVDFWSVDAAGNVEVEQRSDFTVVPAGPLAYVSFVWGGSGTVTLHVENALGGRIAGTVLSGSGTAVTWQVPVPAGGWYRVVCDSWQDVVSLRSGSGSTNTPILAPGQTYTWDF